MSDVVEGSIRRMEVSDVSSVVDIHQRSYRDFFLTSLGPKFLAAYYLGIHDFPEALGLVENDTDGRLSGFVVGATNPARFYRKLLYRRWYRFVVPASLHVIKRSASLLRLLRAFKQPTRYVLPGRTAAIFSIAVAPEAQGSGAGSRLVRTFIEEMRLRNATGICLETDSDNNDAANRFYQQLGFVRIRSYLSSRQRRMNEYYFDLTATGPE